MLGEGKVVRKAVSEGDNCCTGEDLFCGNDGGQGCAVEVKTNLKEIEIPTNDKATKYQQSP